MSSLLDLYATITIDTSGYENGLRDAGNASDEMADRADNAGTHVDKLGPLTVAAGKLIADGFEKAVSAVQNFASYAVSSSIEYESAFAQVQTIMDTTQVSTDDMSTAIKNLSSEMGISASDISESVYGVISATGDTANAVNLVETATKLAKGGFAETADATSVLTTAINAYGLSMEDAESISDSLITVQNLGVTTVGELSSQMGKAIATGAAYGVDLQNLEAGYIALTKGGIDTAESTTYLSSMINELGDAGSDVSGILQEQTGQSFGQLLAGGRDLADVLDILYDSVGYDSEAFANLWSSAEAGKAAGTIAGQGFQAWQENMDALAESAGATQTAYETMSDTTQSKLDVLKTSFQNLSTEAAEPIMEKVNEFIPKITEWIDSINVDDIYAGLQNVLSVLDMLEPVIAGITAAIIAYEAISAVSAATTAIKAAMEAAEATTLWGLAAAQIAANAPMLIAVGIIAAVVAAGVLLYKNWDKVKAAAIALKNKLVEAFTAIKTGVTEKISAMKEAVVNKFNEIKTKATSIFDSIKSGIVDKINAAKDKVKSAIDKIKGFFNFSWSLPKIKMPHFSISGGFSLNPPSIPHFSVSWYKKAMENGLMFTEPTVLATASGYKGFGDAGSEIVIGKDSLISMVNEANGKEMDAMATAINNIYSVIHEYLPESANKAIYLDTGVLAGQMTNKVNKNMRASYIRETRGAMA